MDHPQAASKTFDGYSDHDLLVRIATLQEGQTQAIENLLQEVGRLWQEKAQHSELKFLREALAAKADAASVADHEKRIRTVERWGLMAIGALGVLDVLFHLLR